MKVLNGRALLSAAALLAVQMTSSQVFAGPVPPPAESVPGEFIVKLKANNSVHSMNRSWLAQQLGADIKSEIAEHNLVVIKKSMLETVESVVSTLSQNPMVQYAEPNYIYHINKTPSDPMFGQLWGMKNIGQADSNNQVGVAGVDIGAEQAWDITTGSKDVLLAVIDTGIDYNNPDLKDNVWTNQAELNGKAGVDDDGNGYVDDIHGYRFTNGTESGDPLDDHGHGSHCSGTIGARANDGVGVAGVNWNIRIMGVKFLDAAGSGTLEDAVKAIDYATKNGAKIMSNSWGGGGFAQSLMDAVDRSNKAGALFVAAAGNDSSNNDASPSYPASYQVPNVLSVAAIDNTGKIASFSNYGKSSVHVGAPGVNILSSTTKGYESWSGTSMATPHVSGIAGLLMANEPKLTNLQLKERIMATARPIAGLRGKTKTGGLANAYLALTNQVAPPDMNDPSNWKNSLALSIASAHPYANSTNQTFKVKVPGAKQFALFFTKLDVESGYDFVTVKDATGKVADKISGAGAEVYSAVIDGDSATIEFTSDKDVAAWGFNITKAAWR